MENLIRGAFPDGSIITADTISRLSSEFTSYIIFMTPRSGSTWLMDLLRNSDLGTPQEWLNDNFIRQNYPQFGCSPPRARGTTEINEYLLSIAKEDTAGIFGIKVPYYHALMASEMMEEGVSVSGFTTFYLRRRDLVAQAISLHRSASSKVFHSYQRSGSSEPGAPQFNIEEIVRRARSIVVMEQNFEAMFASCRISPQRLIYEDIENNQSEALASIARTIGAHRSVSEPWSSLTIMRDDISQSWKSAIFNNWPKSLEQLIQRRPPL